LKSVKEHKIETGKHSITVQVHPGAKTKCLILGNGAGAPFRSPFMQYFAQNVSKSGPTTILFNFPYQEAGRKGPDQTRTLEEAYRCVVAFVRKDYGVRRLFLGGKSMGGRIAAHIGPESKADGFVYLGYPLHPPGKTEALRDAVLYAIAEPQLFISGSKDPFCTMTLMQKVLKKCKQARLLEIPDGDHSFKVPAKSMSKEEALGLALQGILDFVK